MIAGRDDLLACRPRTEDVEVGGKTYRARGLTLGARQEYQAALFDVDARGRLTVKRANADDVLLLHGLVGQDDLPLLTTLEEARSLDPSVTDPICAVIRRLSGLDGDDQLGKD